MTKPINQFGGWLSFFLIFHSFMVVMTAIGFIVMAWVLIESWGSPIINASILIPYSFKLISSVYVFITTIYLLKIVVRPMNHVPTKVSLILISMTVVFILTELIFHSLTRSSVNISMNFKAEFRPSWLYSDLAKTIIWLAYFKVSKRVRSFYGRNSFT